MWHDLNAVFRAYPRSGIRELLKLSNETIDNIVGELKRTSSASATRNDGGEVGSTLGLGCSRLGGPRHSECISVPLAQHFCQVSTLLYDLLMDSASCRKRCNDYAEGLLVQTAQRLDGFKAAYLAERAGAEK